LKLLDFKPTYRTFTLTLRTGPTATGIEYWVEWQDWEGNWSTDLMNDPDQAMAIAKLTIDRHLSQKIVQFKRRIN
jgi:hypothetical protein